MTTESVTLEIPTRDLYRARELAESRGLDLAELLQRAVREYVGPTRNVLEFLDWCKAHPRSKLTINSRPVTLEYVLGYHLHVTSEDGDPETYSAPELIELRRVQIPEDDG